MLKILFNFNCLSYSLVQSDDEIILLDIDFKKVYSINFDTYEFRGYTKRNLINDLKGVISADIENCTIKHLKDYFKNLLKEDIKDLQKTDLWAYKSNKKRTTKSDVIKYLNGYKYKYCKRGSNYWATCAPYIDNCIKALKGGY